MKKRVYFKRVMTGYEFIEFMREFRWRHRQTGKPLGKWKYGPYGQIASEDELARDQIRRDRFEGWKYWFDRMYPDEILHEEREIIYWADYKTYKNGACFVQYLKKKGFQVVEEL